MRDISSHNAAGYLHDSGHVRAGEQVDICELAGGVSNAVLLVTLPERGERFVLKQARSRLRVKDEWLCPIERIWREVEVLRACGELLTVQNAERGAWQSEIQAHVPQWLWEDRENYLYAMSAAPLGQQTWKAMLLAGEHECDSALATACGHLLGRIHGSSWNDTAITARFADRSFFDQLRLDPYYRQIARVHPDLAPAIDQLIESLSNNRHCLVHGDFSPKNLLVWPGHVMLIDFEVGHFGDPAFDLGFFLTHLVLKSLWAGAHGGNHLALAANFWRAYRQILAAVVDREELVHLERRMLANLAGCLLARVDGKSPVDYLAVNQQARVRKLAKIFLLHPPMTWEEAQWLVKGETE